MGPEEGSDDDGGSGFCRLGEGEMTGMGTTAVEDEAAVALVVAIVVAVVVVVVGEVVGGGRFRFFPLEDAFGSSFAWTGRAERLTEPPPPVPTRAGSSRRTPGPLRKDGGGRPMGFLGSISFPAV